MRWVAAVILTAAVVAAASPAAAGMAPPGAASCGGCHAPIPGSTIPDLTGRDAGEIVADMQAFRSGTRPATVMDRIAKGFSDAETRAIADWLASTNPAGRAEP